ncbi:MAG: uroporphyrinogen decarboxylase family protein [Acidimicrobiales bacterium]
MSPTSPPPNPSPQPSRRASRLLVAARRMPRPGSGLVHAPGGPFLPEYRAVRGEGSIIGAIAQPELAAEITLQPVRRYGVDAAVLYSDIVTPAHAIGVGIDVVPGVGPVVERPFRSRADLARLRPLTPRPTRPTCSRRSATSCRPPTCRCSDSPGRRSRWPAT